MTVDDQHRDFWERRLADDWTESGVGYKALGRPFNRWMYRVRRNVFTRETSALGLDASSRVLDIGSGTGFYVDGWQRLGMSDVVGSDLTEAAVEQLRARYPDARFVRLDITEDIGPLEPASFDVASCMDVLFHIVDDERYKAAIDNIGRVVRPGGRFVLSENFLHRRADYTEHQVSRTIEWVTSVLRVAGFEIERRVPMLILMNAQVDAPAPWRKAWGGALRAATLTPPTGWLAGAALYPIERQLVRRFRESPTTEMMICRRLPHVR
ncbi:class I SAM-dependent methyltransferase [Actinobacteria bacterium YIM 96077]|uniref:Class I SAM-dependent methyltransferase n=1 Tax=Phytoactinopolyspora halophila TaxID=1981511 RepID=A0A329R1W2_9ACTN|nr:class I SAM-dependent methyltransferase [Phytoactinopolyspora halophila]AYY11567.1 class I SAM-dependent methyltransferase [Actinobacteria bacterium YIM 96077]RAW17949.1 class I SAM-dependent methyltransferase [Phytoactinopolyspora halophila]